jgi:hypothetical protein
MNTGATSERRRNQYWYWVCQIGGWGCIFAAQVVAARLILWSWNRAVLEMAAITVALLLATHLIRWFAHRDNWFELGLKALVWRCLVLSPLIAVGAVVVLIPIEWVFFGDRRLVSGTTPFLVAVNVTTTLLLWHMLYFGTVLLRQRQQSSGEEARLRAALRTAELGLLKSQLNPHFLFNALNTVRALISESPERAQLAVTQLARTLRYSLNSARDEIVNLATELEIVEDYLGIETLRLAERLTIVKQIAANTMQTRIPIMLLQTLVENAVKHGISQLPQGGTLTIAAHMDSHTLVIEVSNDRPLIKSGSIPSDRVGLANASERLRLMIGASASLTLDLSHPQRAQATVRIPQTETGK